MSTRHLIEPAADAVLFPGTGEGPLVRLTAPLSFWGGVDPRTGTIVLAGHPQVGLSISGVVLAYPDPIGSSSSSSVLLELIHAGQAPAAILLGQRDAILVVGCIVAREMGLSAPPVLEMSAEAMAALPDRIVGVQAT
jgi:predicted aconitase with swiveling domain